jgi:hypothetical protein
MSEYIRGKQLAAAEITSRELAVGALSADATGRAIIASGYFNLATVNDKFAAASIADDRLAVAYIKQDGTRAFGADQSMGGFKLTNLGAPTAASDAARLADVQAVAAGLAWKDSVRAATTGALAAVTYANGTAGVGATLTADANGALAAQDGITLIAADRLLVKNQVAGLQNGIYTVTQVGDGGTPFILTRVTDADTAIEVEAAAVFIEEGTTLENTGWVQTADNVTIGTNGLVFTQFTGSGITAGAGLTLTGSTLDVGAGNGIQVNANDVEVLYGNSGTMTTVNAGDTASAGVNNSAARSDHQHPVSTAAPTVTIKSEATAAAEGAATSLMRSDAQIQAATATAVAVAATNGQGSSSSLSRADHTHQAAFEVKDNKRMVALVADADGEKATNTTLAKVPALGSWIRVLANGTGYSLADGDAQRTTRSFYFSADSGATARALSALQVGDELFFNPTIAGFSLDASDLLDLDYEAFGG